MSANGALSQTIQYTHIFIEKKPSRELTQTWRRLWDLVFFPPKHIPNTNKKNASIEETFSFSPFLEECTIGVGKHRIEVLHFNMTRRHTGVVSSPDLGQPSLHVAHPAGSVEGSTVHSSTFQLLAHGVQTVCVFCQRHSQFLVVCIANETFYLINLVIREKNKVCCMTSEAQKWSHIWSTQTKQAKVANKET